MPSGAVQFHPVTAAGRTVETRWADDGRVYRLEVDIGPSDDPTGEDRVKRTVTLAMPLAGGTVRYTPGLIEDAVVDIPLADFSLFANQLYLPLANGLIGVAQRYASSRVGERISAWMNWRGRTGFDR